MSRNGRLSWRAYKQPRVFYWETPHDADTALVAVPQEDGSLSVSVSEEQAVDSYNSYFDCTITLPRAQAEKLRDMLNEAFPPKGNAQ